VQPSRYRLRDEAEDRKQLYWGAFMVGCAAFHQHRRAGFWLDAPALEDLALRRFQASLHDLGNEDVAFVDDERLGQSCFIDGFTAGYRARAERNGLRGLVLRRRSSAPHSSSLLPH
jgi:hypothetical protein